VQRALAAEDWGPIGLLAIRIAVHSGQVERRGDHYFGPALFRTARLQSLAWGEQTLLSEVAAELASDGLPEGASLRDLGTHRLKDLSEPKHVFQLIHPDLRNEFPPVKSLDPQLHNLPVQATTFLGREAEIAEVTRLLESHRLVSLVGPGGIGKTRLALQVAAETASGFADGVAFVDLAPLREPELVSASVATALGLTERPGEPITDTLAHHLAAREQLLLLDNLEQLLPEAGRQVAHLLSTAPNLRVLDTTRAPLHVRGETEYPVPGLPAGSAGDADALSSPAVALFLERARDVRPDVVADPSTVRLVTDVCRHLDGLPLAIELAAARLRLFGLEDLRDRLSSADATSGGLSVLTGGALVLNASSMEKGLAAMSPASTTCWSSNGMTRRAGLKGRSKRLACRMALGPNRAPGRYVTPASNGPNHGDVEGLDVSALGEAGTCAYAGVTRHLGRVELAGDLTAHLTSQLSGVCRRRVGPQQRGHRHQHPCALQQEESPQRLDQRDQRQGTGADRIETEIGSRARP